MGLPIAGLSNYIKLGGVSEILNDNGKVPLEKGFLDLIFKSDDDDLRNKTGTIGTFKQPEFFKKIGLIVPDGPDLGGIVEKKNNKYNPYILSERPAEYDYKTGKWEYSDTKKRPNIIA